MLYIDNILKDKKLSKTEVAKRMGLSRESLYRILTCNPTLDNLQKLANALEVSISELFEKKEEVSVYVEYKGERKRITEKDLIRLFD
ncbi:MAG: helix-turn-helix transcriptional regulator [Clostridiales bacterium]|jgi:transcriptional regulator with XRE-family HTH domain|nr:helix-turn-helix transcriptional regulator [Clostridiales bacterium]